MHREYEAKYHALEEQHWWFRARRNAVRSLLVQLCPHRERRILEIGCSSGVLIRELEAEGYRSVVGIDISEEAIRSCHERGLDNVRVMDAQRLDFPDASFDAITASDVLEHLADDCGALRDWHRVLTARGHIFIFVPAFQSLWSEHDVANHHHRRYRLAELTRKVRDSGFHIERESYWNTALFLPIAAVRTMKRIQPRRVNGAVPSNDLYPPPRLVNWGLFETLNAENALFLRGVNFPFGVSAMVVARKLR